MHFKLFRLDALNNLMVQINIALGTLAQLLIKKVHAHCALRFGCVHR
ncbi:hypothetical protein [Pseudidiomarina tainanensis]|nr:hypothetical protein [Pseudidiomarina tainanensis]